MRIVVSSVLICMCMALISCDHEDETIEGACLPEGVTPRSGLWRKVTEEFAATPVGCRVQEAESFFTMGCGEDEGDDGEAACPCSAEGKVVQVNCERSLDLPGCRSATTISNTFVYESATMIINEGVTVTRITGSACMPTECRIEFVETWTWVSSDCPDMGDEEVLGATTWAGTWQGRHE